MSSFRKRAARRYGTICVDYVLQPDESHLADAAELGQDLLQKEVPVEEIAEFHHKAVTSLAHLHPELSLAEIAPHLSAPLVELLVAYSLAYRKNLADKQAMETHVRDWQHMEAIGQLAGGVAHDMNNILSAISGVASVLLKQMENESPLARDVENMLAACRRGHDLTRNLLCFARRETLEQRPLLLNDTVHEVRQLLQRTLPKGVAINVDVEENLPFVMGDGGMMTHVLLNLALNAVDAMNEKGTLTITTSRHHLNADEARSHLPLLPGPYVKLEVADTGEGMPQEVRRRVFEPFFTTKAVGKGTGLGLSMVHGTIRDHKGDVSVDSEVGQGTTISILLPALDAEAVEASVRRSRHPSRQPRSSPVPQPHGRAAVLLVDDEELVRLSGKRVLEQLGYDVLLAEHGQRAVEIYQERFADIAFVVLDLMMPVMDGAETFIALQELNPDVQVLIATGYFSGHKAELLLQVGAVGIVEKPYTLQDMASQIKRSFPSEVDLS